MAQPTVDELIDADAWLDRSAIAVGVSLVAGAAWSYIHKEPGAAVGNVLTLVQVLAYVWYAFAAGSAARALGEPGATYVAWILVAPIVSTLIFGLLEQVSGSWLAGTAIGVSPLSIKFLLGAQLDRRIRERAVED